MKIKKILVILLSIITLVSLSINYIYLKEHQRKDYHYTVFIDQINTELRHIITNTNKLTEHNLTGDNLQDSLNDLTTNLAIFNHSLQNSVLFIDGVDHKGQTMIGRMNKLITSGYKINQQFIPRFAEDNKLSPQESLILNSFYDLLKQAREQLNTESDSQQISKNRLNDILDLFSSNNFDTLIKRGGSN
ncbi:hypothetical protein [Oceanobacillus kapialis]|uniref:hypothetical protein n=1 Tax=Oceanobacillus kapialis TaxID=481353 RepID=UPI00384DC297